MLNYHSTHLRCKKPYIFHYSISNSQLLFNHFTLYNLKFMVFNVDDSIMFIIVIICVLSPYTFAPWKVRPEPPATGNLINIPIYSL